MKIREGFVTNSSSTNFLIISKKELDADDINYNVVMEIFGQESADKYKELNEKGFHTYIGYTSSDDDCLTAFMTVDNFIIDKKDFYMNGESCVW